MLGASRMDIRWGWCIALPFASVGLSSVAEGQTATAGVTAEVVSPSDLSEAATEWLVSQSPGVFTLRIPGTSQAPAITITAQASNDNNGTISFFLSREGADALRNFLAKISSSSEAVVAGTYQISDGTSDGTISTYGVQMILTNSVPNDNGRGLIVAVIAFD